MMEVFLTELFRVCIIPLLGLLTAFIVKFLNAKSNELINKVDNDMADKYIAMLFDTISTCVIATNQTYVNNLKADGVFDKEAQKVAFEKTYNAVMEILADDAKEYLESITNDTKTYLTQLIEAEVNRNRA